MTSKEPDNSCLLKSGEYCTIVDISDDGNDIKCRPLKSQGNFFSEPIDSRSVGIHLVKFDNSSSGCLFKAQQKDILCKVILLPYNDKWVVIPLCHGNDSF